MKKKDIIKLIGREHRRLHWLASAEAKMIRHRAAALELELEQARKCIDEMAAFSAKCINALHGKKE